MKSIIAAVHQHAQQEPDRSVILFADQTITYGQLYADIERFAQALVTWGLQSGERVGLFLDNCPTFVTAYLGTHLAGGVVVLVNTQYRQIELSHIINDAGVRLCVTSAAGARELSRLSLPTLATLVVVGDGESVSLGGNAEYVGYAAFVAGGVLMGYQGRRKAPATHPCPPDPYGWVPPLPCDESGERAMGIYGGVAVDRGLMGYQGRHKAPATHPSPPDPYGWVPPLPCDESGEGATGIYGGMVDVGRGPCADPGSPNNVETGLVPVRVTTDETVPSPSPTRTVPLNSPYLATMPAADAPAVIAYTSGTTGKAKGALLTHGNLTANITAVIAAWHWTAQDRLLLTLPLFHAHGLMVGMHGTLFVGGSVVLRTRFDASDVLASFKDDPSISLFFGVPTMYTRLLAETAKQGASAHKLRLFVSGSAPLSAQVFADFERVFGQQILERYGMTETIMNLTNPYEGERRAGTVGSPFPGQEARIVDSRTRQILPSGEIGEIEVRGPNVFAGYWQRPEATAEAFSADGWFRTGDLGWCSSDGYFTITGRARELIISGGYNIYPREIEDVLMMHPGVVEAAVLGRPDSEMGEQVVAFIVPNPDQPPSAADLIAFCRERLASYKKPRCIIFVEALPRNALGKVQKHILEAICKEMD